MIYAIDERDRFGVTYAHGYCATPELALAYACQVFETNTLDDVPADMLLAARELLAKNRVAVLAADNGDEISILPLTNLDEGADPDDEPGWEIAFNLPA